MATYVLKRKLFFDYGLTSVDIQNYMKQNNVGAKDAYTALKQQRQAAGVNEVAFKGGDRSAYAGNTKVTTVKGEVGKSGGSYKVADPTTIKKSAYQAGQSSSAFNKGYNAGKASISITTATTPKPGPGGVKGWWNGLGTGGKVGIGLAGAALVGGGIYAATRNKNKDN